MKIKVFMTVTFLVLCISLLPVFAELDTIIFSTEEWKDATNQDGTGLYWDIFRAIYEPENLTIKPKIRSYLGSVNLIQDKKVDAMVGAYINEIDNVIYPKNYFAVDIVQAIYPRNPKIEWKGIETLKGKRVSWIKAYSLNDYLPEKIKKTITIREISTRKAAFKLFKIKRIDFFLDAQADLNDFFKEFSNKYPINNYVRNTILELKLYVVFRNDLRGKQLADIFDKRFSKLLKNGKIMELYKKYKHANFTIPSEF